MESTETSARLRALALLVGAAAIMASAVAAGGDQTAPAAPSRATLLAVARELMTEARYCALVTLDGTGAPQVRVIDPFPPDEDMVVWLGTHRESRKVAQIEGDPRVALHYYPPGREGYVTILGRARLVDDPDEKARRWQEEWRRFYPDREATYLLIEVTPERLEVLSVEDGIVGDPATWTPPAVDFAAGGAPAGRADP